jgi:hypothetical protein
VRRLLESITASVGREAEASRRVVGATGCLSPSSRGGGRRWDDRAATGFVTPARFPARLRFRFHLGSPGNHGRLEWRLGKSDEDHRGCIRVSWREFRPRCRGLAGLLAALPWFGGDLGYIRAGCARQDPRDRCRSSPGADFGDHAGAMPGRRDVRRAGGSVKRSGRAPGEESLGGTEGGGGWLDD